MGTIEPRKNHTLLLDVWEELFKVMPEKDIPILHIVGKRGWNNDAFFQRLDTHFMLHTKITEHHSMDDAGLNALLGASSGLLFPSYVEGYGLPAIEALAVGVPVICSDIPVFKELLEQNACILPCNDLAAWTVKILEISKRDQISSERNIENELNIKIPDWPAHFCHVFK